MRPTMRFVPLKEESSGGMRMLHRVGELLIGRGQCGGTPCAAVGGFGKVKN